MALGVPDDAVGEVLFNVVAKVVEYLVERLNPLNLLGVFILVLLDNAVAKELGRAHALLDMSKGSVAHGNPGENHDTVANGAKLCVHRVGTVRILEFGNGHQSIVDRLEQLLIDGHVGAVQVGLGGLCCDEEELALFLETSQDSSGLQFGWGEVSFAKSKCPCSLHKEHTCLATRPPIPSLSLPYLATAELTKASKSSMDSGSSSGAGLGADRGVGADELSGDETAGWFKAGASLSGSSVDVAMSSRREVAASSLRSRLAYLEAYAAEGNMAIKESVPLDERCKVVHLVGGRHGDGRAQGRDLRFVAKGQAQSTTMEMALAQGKGSEKGVDY